MEAKELMIGDWVYFYHPHEPEKKIVTRHRITETYECGLVGISDHYNPVHADHIEPIKITPEILEKNGFVNDDNNDGLRYYQSCGDIIGVDIRGDFGYLEDADLKYVHRLQHALRLCGIEKEITL